ncbi:hypothetical protein [Flavihumibacter sp.]|uniref:hypothetical protein n=1 Tax=Flavihumibacter sp. TaxID=1913981 RepID=UPI002FC7E42C
MKTSTEFKILIRRRIPYLNSFLLVVIIIFLICICILNLVMYPAIHSKSSLEMVFSYYNLVVPETLKVLSSYSFLGFIFVVPLYYKVRRHKPGILTFEEERILIKGQKIYIDTPKSRIEKIYCNDLKNIFGKPKRIFQSVIKNKEGLHTSFRLKDYETGGEFIDKLETLNVVLAGYENEMVIDHDEE